MDFRSRVDPAVEARYREVMDAMGVYDAQWALSKVLEVSDVQQGQNRLLLTKDTVRAGSILKVFPELEELGEDGRNAEHKVDVTLLDVEGHEREAHLRYLNSNKAYRVMGSEWRVFVIENGVSRGDLLDLYTCRRGDDGERCLFFFWTKGWDASGAPAAWCTNGRKRARQPAAGSVIDPDDEEVFVVNGGRADGGDNGKHYGDVDYTRAKRDRRRDRKRRAKNGSHARRDQDHTVYVTNDDDMHAWTGGLQQGDYGCYKVQRRREDKQSWDLDATPDEREAAKGLLMLKYAFYAERY